MAQDRAFKVTVSGFLRKEEADALGYWMRDSLPEDSGLSVAVEAYPLREPTQEREEDDT